MSATKKMLRGFLCDERGLETVEYAIIAGLIVAGVIATVTSIGIWVATKFEALEEGLSGGGETPAP
ncbi:MAG: Flp family type IVb pilin [Phycisphaerae bacterium]